MTQPTQETAIGSTLSRRQFLQAGAAVTVGASAAERLLPILTAETLWEQSSDKKVRIGVVGGGFGLAFHWHEHPNCIVEAVSDLIPERRQRLMGKYKCDKAYKSLEELVLDSAVDAVAIFTPAPDHARHTVLCMEHGKHVISACPACISIEQAEKIKDAKEKTGLRYMNAETSYYRWETIAVRRLMEQGELGELVYTEGEYYHPGIGRTSHELSWRDGKRTWRYGYPPMLYPTHSTAFLVGATRERLVKVSCIGTGDPEEPALRDNDYGNTFMNGMAMFLTDKGHPFRCNVAWDIFADGERAQWFGNKGAVYSAGSAGQPFTIRIGHETISTLPDYWGLLPETMRYDSGHGASHPFITNEFVMALVEDREPAIDLYESLAFCVPGIIAHESAKRDGEQLSVPQFERK
mgnify:CR=1 FL=1